MEQTLAISVLLLAVFVLLSAGVWIALSLVMVGVIGIATF